MRKRVLIALFFAFVFVTSCSEGLPPEFPAPDFKLVSIPSKQKVSLSDFKGRPILIYWFTSW